MTGRHDHAMALLVLGALLSAAPLGATQELRGPSASGSDLEARVWLDRGADPLLRRGARAFVPRLAARGVRVFEDPERMMHAKLAVFDDDFAIVGLGTPVSFRRDAAGHVSGLVYHYNGQEIVARRQ